MNPSYAAIFSVHFRVESTLSTAPDTWRTDAKHSTRNTDVPLQFHQDYQAFAPLVITQIVKTASISWQGGNLGLPSDKLKRQKKQLWSLIGEQLDKL